MIWILLGVLLLTLFYYYGIKSLTYWRDHGVKQQDLFPAFCTNWFTMIRKQTLADYLKKQYNRFPESRYQGIYLFNSRVLVVKDIDLIKQMVIKDFECFNEHRSLVNEDVDPIWGKNLFALKGSQWRNMRSTLSPSFTSNKMKGMFQLMTDTAERFVNFFLNQNKDLIEIEMKEVSSRYCNDVIASAAFGLEVDSLADPNNEFYTKGKEFTDLRSVKLMIRFFISLFFPSVARMFNVKLIQSHIVDFFTNIVEDTIKMREEKGLVRPDMIHLLLEARKGHTKHDEHQNVADTGYATVEEHLKGNVKTDITNEDIIAQALVFFLAGFDSSSTLISFMAYELCVNQDIQNRLREEITETLANCNNKLTYEALVNMKYMDMVVSESLRKWPVQVAIDRVCTKPYTIEPTLPGEIPVHLSPGDLINLPIYGIHQDPELFPDPEVFDPERFSDDNKGNIKPYAFQPFGLGPRNCIGSRFALLETKILYFHLLANFKIVPIDTSVIPLKMGENMFSILPKYGFNMGLKRV